MQEHNSITAQPVAIRNGIAVLTGAGIRVSVDRRHLALSDGVGRRRRRGRFAKATSRLKRLIVIGRTGYITFDALHWLRDIGASYIHLDYDAAVVASSIAGLDDARLRRAQALLPLSSGCVSIARELLKAKIKGQLAVINSFDLGGSSAVEEALQQIEECTTLDDALLAELKAADAYWRLWAKVEMRFARRDRVPDHWRTFGARRSPLTLRPQKAVTPINAILNCLFRYAEIETQIALASRALDTGLGIWHTDEPNRSSLSSDVSEVVRPHIEAFVLNLVRTKTFSARDFIETREGGCRLNVALARELAETMPTWANYIKPYADSVARAVTAAMKSGLRLATPMSPAFGRINVPVVVRSAGRGAGRIMRPIPQMTVSNSCRTCGAKLKVRNRLFCDTCLPERRSEVQVQSVDRFRTAGPAKLAQLRAQGFNPTNTPEAAARRSKTARERRRAVLDWRDDGSLKGVDFKRDIRPKLEGISIRKLAAATGFCASYCSKVRAGRLIPHRRHWRMFSELADREQR